MAFKRKTLLKRIFLALGLLTALLLGVITYNSAIMDTPIGLYDDFIGPQEKRSNSIIVMDIPLPNKKSSYQKHFNLPLRRSYWIYIELVAENGNVIADLETKIHGNVQVLSTEGEILLQQTIPDEYPLNWQQNELLDFSFREIGSVNEDAILTVTNLDIIMSDKLKTGKTDNVNFLSDTENDTITNLRLRVIIHPRYVGLH